MNHIMLVRTVALGAMASVALGAYAIDTEPPPLPPGSARVQVEPGQSKEENERMQRAHEPHAPSQHTKDYTHDDTAGTDQIVAPPLPPGSTRVRVEPGQSPEETRRILRAHRAPKRNHLKSKPSSPIGSPS
jgi:hypothetical protein